MVTDEKNVASKYLSLLPDPEKATLHHLVHDLFSSNVAHSDLLSHNIPEEKENKYLHRGIIFLSLFVQTALKYLSSPLKKFGSIVEHFLNRNIISGKGEARLNEESVGFISFLGHLDTRMDLDQNIKHDDARYYPALAMMASKLAYENKSVIENAVSNHWKMEFLEYHDLYNEFQNKFTTQAYMFREEKAEGDMIVVAFRGTSPFDADDWCLDFDLSWCKIEGMGKAHKGFMTALGLKKYYENDDLQEDYIGSWPKNIEQDDKYPLAYYTIRERLREILTKNSRAKFMVTGHSLGAALAVLFPAILALHDERDILDRLEGIYTYGQPRVGNEKFGEFVKKNLREHDIKYYRIVYGYDVVPTVPWDNTMMTFKHFGRSIHFNSLYHSKILEEENILVQDQELLMRLMVTIRQIGDTVTSPILPRLNALWELIRAFIIPLVAGPEYREEWPLIVFRIFGMLTPGAADHNTRDYVNATRLASSELFDHFANMRY